ncbi:MAG: reverse transcriptase domain-containing protein [Fusobacteriaceae bacterium]
MGIILKKANKDNYQLPKSYRIISLLNCLGKISEKVIASRLGYLAETTTLLDPSQIGGRTQKSAIDACLALTHEIQKAKKGKITTFLAIDIKGAFDHVAQNRLLEIY